MQITKNCSKSKKVAPTLGKQVYLYVQFEGSSCAILRFIFPEQCEGISLYIREHFRSKLKETTMTIMGFFVELDLRKRKWIIGCFYNPKISVFIVILLFYIFVLRCFYKLLLWGIDFERVGFGFWWNPLKELSSQVQNFMILKNFREL